MEVEVKKIMYRIGKMSPWDQFHVARKLAPVLWSAFDAARAAGTDPTNLTDMATFGVLGTPLNVLARMSNEDSEYVMRTCLNVVARKDGVSNKFMPVTAANGAFMYDDIKMPDMVRLVFEVMKDNLGDFMDALPEQGLGKQEQSAT
jgi:hypothetical protein